MKWLAFLICLSTQPARAQSANELTELTRNAHDAAIEGRCDEAARIASQVQAVDAEYYKATFAADPDIAACLVGDASQAGPSALPRRAVPAPATKSSSTGRSQPDRTTRAAADWITQAELKEAQTPSEPPLDGGRIAGEVGAAVLLGGAFAAAGGFVGYQLSARDPDCYEYCGLPGLVIGAWSGYMVGVTMGVYWVGASGNQTGSFIATFVGSLAGSLAGVAAVAGTQPDEGIVLLGLLGGPPLGAIIGFNLTRSYDESWAPVATITPEGSMFGMAADF